MVRLSRVAGPVSLHPRVPISPLVESLVAAGLATEWIDDRQQSLLRRRVGTRENGVDHRQHLVCRKREGLQRTGLQLARQVAVVRPVSSLQSKDDRQGVSDCIGGFQPRSQIVPIPQTFQRAIQTIGVRAQGCVDDGQTMLFRDDPLLVDQLLHLTGLVDEH